MATPKGKKVKKLKPVSDESIITSFKQLLRKMFIPLDSNVDMDLQTFSLSVTGGENPAGYVKLENGKMAQVRILVEADQSKWIDDDGILINHFYEPKKK